MRKEETRFRGLKHYDLPIYDLIIIFVRKEETRFRGLKLHIVHCDPDCFIRIVRKEETRFRGLKQYRRYSQKVVYCSLDRRLLGYLIIYVCPMFLLLSVYIVFHSFTRYSADRFVKVAITSEKSPLSFTRTWKYPSRFLVTLYTFKIY